MFGKREEKYFKEFRRIVETKLWIKLRKKKKTEGSKSFWDDEDVYTDGTSDYLPYICPEDGYFDVLTSTSVYFRIEEDRIEQWKWMLWGESSHIKLNTFKLYE